MYCVNIIKNDKIVLAIIKLFCLGILRKYCVVAIYTICNRYGLCVDVHGSVHRNTNLIEMTNKMQLCRAIYYSIVP